MRILKNLKANPAKVMSPPMDSVPHQILVALELHQQGPKALISLLQTSLVNWSFNAKWCDELDWLEYSISRDAALCYPCHMFTAGRGKSQSTLQL